jgi:hypothetical protein
MVDDPAHPVPAFIQNRHRTEAQLWRDLEAQFRDDANFVRGLRLERRSEALKKLQHLSDKERESLTEPAFEPDSQTEADINIPRVKHSGLLVYRATDDLDRGHTEKPADVSADLRDHLEYALSAVDELEELFSSHLLTPELLLFWGNCEYAVGYVMNSYLSGLSHVDDLGPERAGIAGAKAVFRGNQRKWVAHLIDRRMRVGRRRKQATADVAKAISDLIARENFTPEFPRPWYQQILDRKSTEPKLISTYAGMSMAKIRELVKEPCSDIPPIDIEIPIV